MRAFWDSVVRPLLTALAARVVVEVGLARGGTTTRLLEYAAEHGAVVHGIDPAPHARLEQLRSEYGERFVFHETSSLDALPEIRAADLVLIDGDHNWYSVFNELRVVASIAAEEDRPFPLTLLHDVDWPYGRRDMYFTPEAIPDEYRHEWRQAGLLPGVQEPGDRGLNSGVKNAIVEGGSRNGIRTAVEDFLAETNLRLDWSSIPGFFGLGILADEELVERTPDLKATLAWFRTADFMEQHLRRLEQARLALSIRLNEMQLERAKLRTAR